MIKKIEAEVLIVGAGPAGTTCALTLAGLGRSVVLCEADRFPREHVGVSLSPGVAHQLEFLGVGHVLRDPAHLSNISVEMRWASPVFEAAPSSAFIADRGRLDGDLLAAAADCGVRVLQPVKIENVARQHHGWIAEFAGRTIRVNYVVDARGRSSRNRPPRRWLGPPTIAIRALWKGAPAGGVRIGAAASSWSWTAPIGGHRRLAIAFTSPRLLRRMNGSLSERYSRLLDDAGVLDPLLELDGQPRVCDATPYIREGEDGALLRIGDADAALDPLSSSGVQSAIQSALRAGPVLNTLLTQSADGAAAIEYWNARRSVQATTHRRWSSDRYAEAFSLHQSEFWRVRATSVGPDPRIVRFSTPMPFPDQRLKLSRAINVLQAPNVIGGLVVRATSLSHPNLPEPVAFVDGVPLHMVIETLSTPKTASELIAYWQQLLAPGRALALLGWLWRNEMAVAC